MTSKTAHAAPLRYKPSFIHTQFPLFVLSTAEDKTKGVTVLFSRSCRLYLKAEHRDSEGSFLLIKGTIDDHLYSFVSYYAPNSGQSKFFYTLLKTLDPQLEDTVIFGGNSNLAFDQSVQKSKPPHAQNNRPARISSKVAKIIYQQGLTDIWREMNPTTIDYTHF